MKVIGLDIAKGATGVAIGDASGPPRTRCEHIGGQSRSETGSRFVRFLRDLITVENPHLIAIEGSFITKTDSAHQQKLAHGLGFIAETLCFDRRVPCVIYQPQSWRSDFLGNGRLSGPEAKRQALRMCAMLGWPTDGNDDRAEACGVWATAHLRSGNTKSMHALLSKGTVRGMETT